MEKNVLKPAQTAQGYNLLLASIGKLWNKGRIEAAAAINSIMVNTYWNIGREIVEFEQKGELRAKYGEALLHQLSKDLKQKYGRGFSISNLQYMRLLYMNYQKHQTLSGELNKFQTLSGKLSWSHYVELLGVNEKMERNFYEKQCLIESWSVRELKRQVNSGLFYRIALNRDKKGIISLCKKGNIISNAKDLVRDPYVLEFLNLPDNYSEKELESRLVSNLSKLMLELGKGFSFVARQYRISLDGEHYYVDLVFYHKILKCFVLIDLKIGKVTAADVGQMNMYLNYFNAEENSIGDTAPIGIILSAYKGYANVRYALGGISNNLFVSRYKFYLPDRKELEDRLRKMIEG